MRTVRFDQRGVGMSRATSGGYGVGEYLDDIEAVRCHLGVERWHVFGHSWGGVLAQLYTAAHADRVLSLFLCNSALGVGRDWRRTRQELARHNRSALGPVGFAELAACHLAAGLPGPAGERAARRVFALAYRGYFVDTEPPPAAGARPGRVSPRAARATGRSLLRHPEDAVARDDATRPTIVVYGEQDIFGEGRDIVLARLPSAQHCVLDDCGHVPWIQAADRFSDIVRAFYGRAAKDPVHAET